MLRREAVEAMAFACLGAYVLRLTSGLFLPLIDPPRRQATEAEPVWRGPPPDDRGQRLWNRVLVWGLSSLAYGYAWRFFRRAALRK